MLLHDRKAVRDICQVRASQFTWAKTAKVLLQNYQTVEFVKSKIVVENVYNFGQVA